MKACKYLWIINIVIVLGWLFYIFIIPNILYSKESCIPDLSGYSEKEALNILSEVQIDANIYYVEAEDENVKYSIPSFGSNVKANSTISLYIGKKPIKYYENFIGLMFENNLDYIEEYCKENAISYTIAYEENDDEIPGVIISQSKSTYERVASGDEISFVISSSNQYIQMPLLAGMNVNDALDFINSNNLNANFIYYYSPFDEDIIISQSIEEGIVIKKGNHYAIDLYVSKGMPYDISSINLDNFTYVLINLDISYDIIKVDSNEQTNTPIAVVCYNDQNRVAYRIYISK